MIAIEQNVQELGKATTIYKHWFSLKQIRRFWNKVAKRKHDECWEWTAAKRPDGYGVLTLNNILYRAHRISWLLTFGSIPSDIFVLHKCDNPGCCNPSHLFLGTAKDNAQDSVTKGRWCFGKKNKAYTCPESVPKGEKHWNAKLTTTDVQMIRRLYDSGITYLQLAQKFNICRRAINDVVRRKNWKHVF